MGEPYLLAYLAGCMDSDGYFTIRRDLRAMRAGARSPSHLAQVGLRQVTPQVPQLLHETFGGHLTISQPTAANGRPLWSWHAVATKASGACELLLPYLCIKPEQAQILIDLQARKVCRGRVVSAEELSARDDLRLRVFALNRTGRVNVA